MNRGWVYHDHISVQDQGLTLLDYYTGTYRHSTAQEWQGRLDQGLIRLDGHIARGSEYLQAGQHLEYHRPPWQEPQVPLNYDIAYSDPDVLVVAKPSGLPVLPGAGFLEHTLLGQLQQHYPDRPPVPIHRLGRGTSGLVLLARTTSARAHLSAQMRDRTLKKQYRTLVGPWQHPETLVIEHPIGKCPHPTLGYLYGATATGKYARSDCTVPEHRPATTLLEVAIQTGRPHQIRIHLAAVGHPLIGDPLYGVEPEGEDASQAQSFAVPGDCGYHLHARALTFIHPRTEQTVTVVAPAPKLLKVEGDESAS